MCCCSTPKGEVKDGVKDPVCGMTVDPLASAGKSDYAGKSYFFCGLGCKRRFDSAPTQFAA